MITLTSLSHLTTQAKIFAAMKKSQKSVCNTSYINNKKGEAYIRVTYHANAPMGKAFKFCTADKNITETVLKSLRS